MRERLARAWAATSAGIGLAGIAGIAAASGASGCWSTAGTGDFAAVAVATDASTGGTDAPLDATADGLVPIDGSDGSEGEADVASTDASPLDALDAIDALESGADGALDATESGADGALDGALDGDSTAAEAGTGDGASDALLTTGSLSFGGQGYVEAPSTFALPTGDFTLEAWVKVTAFPSDEAEILARDQNGVSANQFRLGITPSGHPFFCGADATGNSGEFWGGKYLLADAAPLKLATWTHLALVRAGSTYDLLVDGAKVSEVTSALVIGTGTLPFRIGARVAKSGASTPDGNGFDGEIAEVRVWDVARSASVIAAARGSAITNFDPQWSHLTAYWRLDDGAGAIALDQKGASSASLHVESGAPTWSADRPF